MLGSRHIRTIDDELLDFARANPGFGGYWFDLNGGLHLSLTDVSTKAAALPAFAAFLSADQVPAPDRMVANADVRRADYDFITLTGAYAKWNAGAYIKGITRTMIDKQRNRVAIGVIDAAAASEASAALPPPQKKVGRQDGAGCMSPALVSLSIRRSPISTAI